jgi:GNAT superfamily N-acetyltransferase
MSLKELIIRRGTPQDIPAALQLIKELAAFEKAPHEVENTEEKMLEEGFSPNPVYGFHVADHAGLIIGMAIYYFRYSTWKGKRLYLEDLIVTESFRGKGVGKLLFEVAVQESKQTNCNGMVWQVLDWNTPAIEFYKKYQASFDPEWVNCSLSGEQITAIASQVSVGKEL